MVHGQHVFSLSLHLGLKTKCLGNLQYIYFYLRETVLAFIIGNLLLNILPRHSLAAVDDLAISTHNIFALFDRIVLEYLVDVDVEARELGKALLAQ